MLAATDARAFRRSRPCCSAATAAPKRLRQQHRRLDSSRAGGRLAAWPRTTPANPATDFAAFHPSRRSIRTRLLSTGSGRRAASPVAYSCSCTAYNTRFDRAVFRFAQLAHDADADAAPVLFSWPSRGRLLDYKRDHDNATYSRSDLADLLQTAARSPAVSEIVDPRALAGKLGRRRSREATRVEKRWRAPQDHEPDPGVARSRRRRVPPADHGHGATPATSTLFVSQSDSGSVSHAS